MITVIWGISLGVVMTLTVLDYVENRRVRKQFNDAMDDLEEWKKNHAKNTVKAVVDWLERNQRR